MKDYDDYRNLYPVDSQPDCEPAKCISHVNWPHSSRERERAVRWLLGSPAERQVMREAQIVMMLMRSALSKSDSADAA